MAALKASDLVLDLMLLLFFPRTTGDSERGHAHATLTFPCAIARWCWMASPWLTTGSWSARSEPRHECGFLHRVRLAHLRDAEGAES